MQKENFNIKELITRLLSVCENNKGLTKTVTEMELITLCNEAKDVFMSQTVFIEINPPVRICGDTHGQYSDVLRLFSRCGFPPLANYLFLGDYVDRGEQNLETVALLFCYKVIYKNNFFMLRGNHECEHVNRVYGFYEECNRRYQSQRLWQAFQDVFHFMPLCALVGERILCMHGGISPNLKNLDQLRIIQRPCAARNASLEKDLLWADPMPGITGFRPNMRGASFEFGADVLELACKQLNVDLVARAHQVVQDGYEFFGGRRLVTVFSAPHYCGEFDNAAAVMIVDPNLVCSFQVLRPSTSHFCVSRVIPTSSANDS
uniref:Serine/threonine-protein phosphatase n=1 Tax=Ascaris lumbricoides TaxID=6252 RepID=A0A9J2PAU7_ASCLU